MDCERAMIPFEQENLKAYMHLLRIEIALRECLKESWESEYGKHWQKRLPGDLLATIRRSQDEEHKPQFNFIRLGPLYYLDFGHLLALLQQKPSRSVVEKLGGGCFLKQLENLFAPRNAICHSRGVSSVGLKAIETVYAQMETALTVEELSRLTAHPDIGLRQDEAAKAMVPRLQQILCDLPNLPSAFTIPREYQTAITQFWWADDSLAGFNRSCVESAVALIHKYNALPSGVGSAGDRLRFCEQCNMKRQIEGAITELRKVIL